MTQLTRKNVLSKFPAGIIAGLLIPGCLISDPSTPHASVVDRYLGTPFVDQDEPYSDPTRALGPPDGRTVALGLGAVITLRFFRDIPAGAGPDLRIIEIGPDDARARVAVSEDGVNFVEFDTPATASGASLFELDEVGLTRAQSVRIRGMDNNGNDPGFDLDAAEALH